MIACDTMPDLRLVFRRGHMGMALCIRVIFDALHSALPE